MLLLATDAAAVARAWEATLALGPCRYLVNNAGPPSFSPAPFLDNLTAALGSVELVTTQWLERCCAEADSVVNIASIAGNFSGGGQTISPFYPTAKMGIVGYTRWLATRHGGRPPGQGSGRDGARGLHHAQQRRLDHVR